ncbi:hypothetical protein OROMI_027549 [Orobanche minor]
MWQWTHFATKYVQVHLERMNAWDYASEVDLTVEDAIPNKVLQSFSVAANQDQEQGVVVVSDKNQEY